MTLAQPTSTAPPALRASRSRLIANSLYSVIAYVLYLPVGFWIIRFTVDHIGVKSYGIWAALTTVMAFQGLLDLGITAPLIKYVAEYMALGGRDRVNTLLSTAMVLYASISVVFVGAMLLATDWVLVHLFHAQAANVSLREMYFAVVLGFAFALTFSVLQSLLVGLQRADVSARLTLIFNLESAAGTVVVLKAGLGLQGLALNWVVTVVLTVIGNAIAAKRLFPTLSLNPFLFRWSELRRILGFSTKVQVSTTALFMNTQVDRFLITYSLGTGPLAFYQLASRTATTLSGLSGALMNGVLSAASEFAASNDWSRVRELYLRASRYQAMVVFPLCAGVGVLSLPLVHAWLGPGFERVAVTMMIILAGYVVFLPNQATVAALNGLGRPDIRMRGDIAFVIIHVPLAALLIWRFGYFGTVVGTSLLLVSVRLYIYWAGARVLRTSLRDLLLFSFMQPAIATTIAMLPVIYLQVAGAPLTGPLLAAEALLFGGVYATYMWTVGFDSYDRDLVRSLGLALTRKIAPRPRA